MINPKQLFQESLSPESTFRNVIRSTEMQRAMTFAFAEFALRNTNSEELRGAQRWVDIFTNLAEPEAAPSAFPDKRLDTSVLSPAGPPIKKVKT